MINVLMQAGVSLVAISGIAWLVKKMKLGVEPRIADEAHALRLAEEAESGFDAVDVGRDRAGYSAILRNIDGQMMIIRVHGDHFAARLIDEHVSIRLDKEFLILDVPERSFGPVALKLGQGASVWASRMRDLKPCTGRWKKLEGRGELTQ